MKLRYADAIDYRDYEPRIKKLLDMHIHADSVTRLYSPSNIFDPLDEAKDDDDSIYGGKTKSAKADIIAHAVKRRIGENLEQDPAFYEKFSTLIEVAINDFRNKRISDADYLARAREIRDEMKSGQRDDVPANIRGDGETCAYYGVIKTCFDSATTTGADDIAATTAIFVKNAIEKKWKVDFWHDSNAQNSVRNLIDDFLYDTVQAQHGIDLSGTQMDEIYDKTMQIARARKR